GHEAVTTHKVPTHTRQRAPPPGHSQATKSIGDAESGPRENSEQASPSRARGKLRSLFQQQEEDDRSGVQGQAEKPPRNARTPLASSQAHERNQYGSQRDLE